MAWAPAYGEDRRKDFARAANRARSLRKNETPHEKRLWKLLRELNRCGANFRRQANVGDRVFDFADLGRKLLIELDGAVHAQDDVKRGDKAKEVDAILRGYRVIRITNDELRADSGAVIRRIQMEMLTRPSPRRGEGREGGRTTGRLANGPDSMSEHASPSAPHSPRPLPLPPPPRAGEEPAP